MDIEAYYERIGFTDGGSDTDRLYRLHFGHCTHIPYENLDVYNGEDVSLDPEDLYRKMVIRHRGGYCFEMNGMFHAALTASGFRAYGVLTRLSLDGTPVGPYAHRMNIVEADGVKYICDVGFGGDGFALPLRLETDVVQTVRGIDYRVVPGTDPAMEYTVQIRRPEGFQDMMGFVNKPAREADFSLLSFYMNRSPLSNFRKGIKVNLFTPTGRISMQDMFLTVRNGDDTDRRELRPEEVHQALIDNFGLDVTLNHLPTCQAETR
ncbi:MAG: arylamine N-acetyltransferase [Oscillospiraceae bacterium]|nr:arylamine N-acetyltransferase [Oscillospiraceae bacterium]